MAWQISGLPPVTTNQVVDADLMIINNLGVTRSISIGQMKLTVAGTAFVLNVASPNNVIPSFQALASLANGAAGYTNVDVTIAPKGSGAFQLSVPDNTSIGGQKRGTYSVDMQTARSNAAQVAGGSWSTISGGSGNLIASGTSYCTIGGGQSNSMVTTGGGNTIAGGGTNTITTGNFSAIGGGSFNSVSGGSVNNVIAGGLTNSNAGAYSTISGGQNNSVSTQGSTIPGGQFATDRTNYGVYAYAQGRFSVTGDAQMSRYIGRRATVDATQATVFNDGQTFFSATNLPVLPNNSAFRFTAEVVARDNATGNAGAYTITGLIKRGANAAATSIVGAVTVVTVAEDAGAAAWDVTATADATNGALLIRVTGAAATNIKWVSKINTVEVVG